MVLGKEEVLWIQKIFDFKIKIKSKKRFFYFYLFNFFFLQIKITRISSIYFLSVGIKRVRNIFFFLFQIKKKKIYDKIWAIDFAIKIIGNRPGNTRGLYLPFGVRRILTSTIICRVFVRVRDRDYSPPEHLQQSG